MLERTCRKCLRVKTLDLFAKDAGSLHGYRHTCKQCMNKRYIKKGPCKTNPSWYKKGHVFVAGAEKGWFRKGSTPFPEYAFQKGRPAHNKLSDERARLKAECNIKWHRLEGRRTRKIVLERDNYRCLRCGDSKSELHVHHIKPVCIYPELIYELSNLKTLCFKCHMRKENHMYLYNYEENSKEL